MGRKIEKETSLGVEKRVIYEDEKKVGEIIRENTLGTDCDVEYDLSGNKVSSTYHTSNLGIPVDVTSDPSGKFISETSHTKIIGIDTDITRDPSGKKIGESTQSPWGGYDVIGKGRPMMEDRQSGSHSTEHHSSNRPSLHERDVGGRHEYVDNLPDTDYPTSYSSIPSTKTSTTETSSEGISGVFWLLVMAGIVGLSILLNNNKEKLVAKYHNLVETGILYNYAIGQPLQSRHNGTISFDDSSSERLIVDQGKYFRGDTGLEFKFDLSAPKNTIKIPVKIPDDQITRFEKIKKGKEKKLAVINGELTKRLDVNNDRVLSLEELAVFYDFVGNGINSNLHNEGYYELVNYYGIKTPEKLKEEITTKANDWLKTNFISSYLTNFSEKVDTPASSTNVITSGGSDTMNKIEKTNPIKRIIYESYLKDSIVKARKDNTISSTNSPRGLIKSKHFSFDYTSFSISDSSTNYGGISNLNLYYPFSSETNGLTLSINIPDNSLDVLRVDTNIDNLYSPKEITQFYSVMG